jgi:hypothetical protein
MLKSPMVRAFLHVVWDHHMQDRPVRIAAQLIPAVVQPVECGPLDARNLILSYAPYSCMLVGECAVQGYVFARLAPRLPQHQHGSVVV